MLIIHSASADKSAAKYSEMSAILYFKAIYEPHAHWEFLTSR